MAGPQIDTEKREPVDNIAAKIIERETIVYASAFSPDGEYLACANAFGKICIWKISSFMRNKNAQNNNPIEPQLSFQAHKGPIYSLLFINSSLLSGGDDSTRVWNWVAIVAAIQENVAFEGGFVHELRTQQNVHARGALSMYAETNGLAYDNKNELILGACGDNQGYVWDRHTMQLVRTLKGHDQYLHSVVSLPLSSLACTASEDGTVKTWDVRTAKEEKSMKVGKWVGGLAVDRTETWVVAGGGSKQLFQFHLPSGVRSWLSPSSCQIQSLSFVDNKIVCVGNESYVYHYSFSGDLLKKVPTTIPSVFSVSINQASKNQILVAAGSSPLVNVYTSDYARITTSLYFK